MRVWINFKELRKKLRFEEVLQHYGVEVKRRGQQHQGRCPLPGHTADANPPSFSANLERGIFRCFGCGAQGNVLEFAALMKGVDPTDGDALRTVAVELQQHFFPEGASTRSKARQTELIKGENWPENVLVNQPLDFALKGLDAGHEYLASRGITTETAQYFGVGYCARGMLKDRLAIPLRDQAGQLVGYAGRVIDDASVADDNPRYRFPLRRERSGVVLEFDRSLFLYNGFRIKTPVDEMILVEGFTAVWWLHQHGFRNTVAAMGSDCSEEQVALLVASTTPSGRVWVLANERMLSIGFAQSVLCQVSPHRSVRWARIPQHRRPAELGVEELRSFLPA